MSFVRGECFSCKHWDELLIEREEDTQAVGLCRRHAPLPSTAKEFDEAVYVSWPRTHEEDGCGEYAIGESYSSRPKTQSKD